MSALPQRLGVALLMLVASTFAANHIAARLAFDHGASVATAVSVRSGVTALVLVTMMRLQGVSLRLAPPTLVRALPIGLLVSVQSFCLYSAVARIPVALALLAFNTYPMLLVLLTWAAGGERPPPRVLAAMPVALLGLALALDVVGSARMIEGRWQEIGTGVGDALGASTSFVGVLFLTTRWLKDVDGRLRTLLTMAVTSVVIVLFGAAEHALALPADRAGWLGLTLLTLLYGTAITSLFTIVPRLGAASNTVALNFEPVAALVLGWAILSQSIAPRQILGAFLVIGAIAFLGSGKRRTG